MEKKLSATNTKAEILDAYSELQQKMQNENRKNPKEEKIQQQKEETVKNAASLSADGIVKGLADIKLQIAASLDTVEEALVTEFKKLDKLQEAIRHESSYIEDLYGIKANTDSLAVLLMANKEKKQAFEKEMEDKKEVFDEIQLEKRQQWEKEQKERQQQWKEEEEIRNKTRKREEEEYKYALNLSRKKEEDDYSIRKDILEKELTDKKQAVEKDLAEREKIMANREVELEKLKKEVEDFPANLEKAVSDARQALEEQLTTRHGFQKELYAKEMESEIKLLRQSINSLEGKITEQEIVMNLLNKKTDIAGSQVQAIALKALEGAASLRFPIADKREEKESAK